MLPREKLVLKGPEALTDDELLAIMLGVGTKEESVFELSKKLIDKYGLERLFRMDYKEISKIDGIKLAKATKLLASFEITRRILKAEAKSNRIDDSEALFNYLKGDYAFIENEMLTVIYVNSKSDVIKKEEYSDNHSSSVYIPYRKIVDTAISINAYGIYLCHNHPGGNIMPSDNDIEETMKLLDILNAIGIHLFDHIIIGGGYYYSLGESYK